MADEGLITQLLNQVSKGNKDAETELYRLVKPELRKIALSALRKKDMQGHEPPTVVVDEAFLKVTRGALSNWQDRKMFYGFVARKIGEIVIDLLRKLDAKKRGRILQKNCVLLDGQEALIPDPNEDVERTLQFRLDLEQALEEVEKVDLELAIIVRLRIYMEMTFGKIGECFQMAETTVQNRWREAKKILAERLKDYAILES